LIGFAKSRLLDVERRQLVGLANFRVLVVEPSRFLLVEPPQFPLSPGRASAALRVQRRPFSVTGIARRYLSTLPVLGVQRRPFAPPSRAISSPDYTHRGATGKFDGTIKRQIQPATF
jgi:hypothetical protein